MSSANFRALTLLVFAGVLTINAQDTATISGDLFTSTGSPSRIYSVELTTATANMPVGRAISNSEGKFEFRNVPAGTYTVLVKTSGGELIGLQDVSSGLRSTPIRIQITEDSSQAKPISGTVSAATLQHHAPKKAIQQLKAAIQATAAGDAELAEAHLKVALGIDPDFSEAHTNLGAIYSRAKKLDLAYAEFEKALKLGPQGAMQYCNIAVIALAMNRRDEAEKEVRQALQIESRNPQSNYLLGRMLAGQKEHYEEAVRHLKLAAAEIANANVVLAQLYEQAGRKKEAIAALETYESLNPSANHDKVRQMIFSLR